VLGKAPELVRGGTTEARLEAATLHRAVRNIARADPERCGVHHLLCAVVQVGDELVVARCDLDLGKSYKTTTFDFAKHRRPEHYKLISERTGVKVEPSN